MIQVKIKGNGMKFLRKNRCYIWNFGCGKGSFAASLAYANKDVNYIVIDIKSEMLRAC